jgi:hypothetical protein
MNGLLALLAIMRKIYIRIHNMRLVDTYIVATIRLGVGPVYTALLGTLNAREIERDAASLPPVVYVADGAPTDLATFMVHLAKRSAAARPVGAALDVVLNLAAGGIAPSYASVARLFHSRVNLHVAWTAQDATHIAATLANGDAAAGLSAALSPAPAAPIVVGNDLVGQARARPFHANQARELLKSHGWSAYYCALSLPQDWPADAISLALSGLARELPEWRFVLLGDGAGIQLRPAQCSESLIIPGYGGAEVSVQLALAMECDGYFGVCDHYGVAAILARTPASIFRGYGNEAIQLDALPHVSLQEGPAIESMAAELKTFIHTVTR